MKKSIASLLIFFMICMSFGDLGPVFADVPATFEVSNDYLKYWVNEDNGRFTIETLKGSANPADDNQPLLFKDGIPDTSFSTFMIDGKPYIYGNSYGFLGLDGRFISKPETIGNVTKSVWRIMGVEITQYLTLESTDKNAGNVHIRYQVANTGDKDVSIGSRVLLDTMLGANDGSPLSLPGSQTLIEKETRFEGNQVPNYWKAVDNQYQTSVVSYGLLSGWRGANADATQDVFYNQQPSAMVVGHWQGLSETKWDYAVNSSLQFTSDENAYGNADSAVALYWEPHQLAKGKNRIYETFYGIGEYQTNQVADKVQLLVQAPERLEVNDRFDGYTANKMNINGVVDNSLYQAQLLRNAKVTLEYSQGATLPFSQPKTINIGNVLPNETINFKWTLNTPPLYQWTNFQYKVTLNADNLNAPIERTGNVLIPAISGEPPAVKFTDFNNKFIYHKDTERVITVTGENLNAIVNNGTYRVLLRSQNSGTTVDTVIDNSGLKFEPSRLQISLPASATYLINHNYKLIVEYVKEGRLTAYEFASPLQFSNDVKYRVRTYGLLAIVRSLDKDSYSYKIITADSESALNAQVTGKEKIVLNVRAEKIARAEGEQIYTVLSDKATLNSVVTSTNTPGGMNFGTPDRPMKIQVHPVDVMHEAPYITVTGSGVLSIPNFNFLYGPYIMTLENGIFYEISETDTEAEGVDAEDVNPIQLEFAYGENPTNADKVIGTTLLGGLPVKIRAAILREDSISFGGSIDFAWLFGMLGDPPWKKEPAAQKTSTTTPKPSTPSAPATKPGEKATVPGENLDVDGALLLALEDLRFGRYGNTIGLKGIKASGQIGIPKGVSNAIIPGMDIGAGGRAEIDTFDRFKFEVEAEVAVKVVEAEGKIILKLIEVGGYGVPIPDKVYVYGGFEPGIPIIPAVPVMFLQGLGGGFEGLYDTVTGNFNVLPPLALNATASLAIVKIFVAKKVNLMLSLQRIGIDMASLDIGPVKIFKNLGIAMTFADDLENPAVRLSGYGELDIFDVLYGSVILVFGIDAKHKGALGNLILSGAMEGGAKLPSNWPFVGGWNLGNISAGISDVGVNASMNIIGIPLKVKYEWAGNFSYRLFSSANHDIGYADALYREVVLDENNQPEGTFIVGENIQLISDSRQNKYTASLGDSGMTRLAALNQKNHSFELVNRDNALIEVLFAGEPPVLEVKKPSGEAYPIVMVDQPNQAANAFIKWGEEGSRHSLFISINNPENGTWLVNSDKIVDCKVFEAKNLTTLTAVTTSLTNDSLTIDWVGQELQAGQTAKILLVKEVDNSAASQNAEENLLLAEGIAANALKATVKMPAAQKSGAYKVLVQIMDTDGFVTSTMTTQEAFTYTNLKAPQGVQDLKVTNVGSGMLQLTWNDPKASLVSGYLVDVFDKNTGEFVTSYDITEKTGAHLIGGTYKNVEDAGATAIVKAMNTAGQASSASDGLNRTVKGIVPGKAYLVKVSAYNAENSERYYAETAIADAFLNIPNPAILSHQFILPSGVQIIDKGIVDAVQTYLTKQAQFTCELSSNQPVTYQVSINGNEIQNSTNHRIQLNLVEGDNAISISALNENGDITVHSFKIILDTTPPVLRIDSPEPGTLVADIIRVKGYSEFNTHVTVNGKAVTCDEEGVFVTDVPMTNQLTQGITVVSTDEAGNRSEFVTEIYNNALSKMVGLVIEPQQDYLILGESKDFKVYLKDVNNRLFQIDSEKVAWKTLVKQGVIDVNQQGKVKGAKLGSDVLIASYRISKDYAFEAGLNLDVVTEAPEIRRIYSTPEWVNLKVGDRLALTTYVEMRDGTVQQLKADQVSFRITTGQDSATIDAMGVLKVSKTGAGIVEIAYIKSGKTYLTECLFTVQSKSQQGSGDANGNGSSNSNGNSNSNGDSNNSGIPKDPLNVVTLDDLAVPLGEADRIVLNALKHILMKNGVVTISFKREAPGGASGGAPGGASGGVRLVVSHKELTTAFEQATSDKNKIKTVVLEARFGTLYNSLEFVIPKQFLTLKANNRIVLRTDIGDVHLQGDVLAGLTRMNTTNISLFLNRVAWDEAVTKGKRSDLPMIDFSIAQEGKNIRWSSVKKSILIGIPYALRSGEDPSRIHVWSIDDEGKHEILVSGRYDTQTKYAYLNAHHLSIFGLGYSTFDFKDLSKYAWCQKAIDALVTRGVFNTGTNGKFNPAEHVKRGELISYLMKLIPYESAGRQVFKDVPATSPNAEAIHAAYALGFIALPKDKLLKPTGTVTKREFYLMLDRLLQAQKAHAIKDQIISLSKFTDTKSLDSASLIAFTHAQTRGLLLQSSGKLNPSSVMTRAEVAAVLFKVYNLLY